MARKVLLTLAALGALVCGRSLAQTYPAPSLPLTGSEIIPCIQSGSYKDCTVGDQATFAAGTMQSYVLNSVLRYGAKCNGTFDDGPSFQAAENATPVGGYVYFPASCLINTTVNITKSQTWYSAGTGAVLFVPNVTAFLVTAPNTRISSVFFQGSRSSSTSNIAVQFVNASESYVDNVRCELIGWCEDVQGGFFHHITDMWGLNVVQGMLHLEDFEGTVGIDMLINGFSYNTNGGNALPVTAAIWQQDVAGLVLNNFDIINGGQIANLYERPFGNSVRGDFRGVRVVIQALDVEQTHPRPDGQDRRQDQAVSV